MKKLILSAILSVCFFVLKAQNDDVIKNIELSEPILDSLQIDPYLHFCGIVRDLKINCLDDDFAKIINGVWNKTIKIQSEGAKEMEIVFNKFILSPNTIVSFYTDSLRYQYQGEYFFHKPDSSYISNFLRGDFCIITIEIPMDEFEKNKIQISQIHHLTESFEDAISDKNYSCMIDVNCPKGNNWCDEKRSVAIFRFTEKGGRYQCTGALVNNYRDNYEQYFLTARHCTNKIIDWSTTTFCFNYQNTFCNAENGSENKFFKVQGSRLIGYCDVSWSDNALLLITEPIPIQFNVFYAGVDIKKKSMGDKVTCIHHSKGKPKKIVSGKLKHFAGPKWEMYWDDGIVSTGGSGAPVFYNNNKRVIGTISGGFDLDCSNNLKQDWVGKIRSCVDYSSGINNALFGTNPHYISYYGIDPIQECQSTLNLWGEFHSTQEYDASLNGLTIQAGNTIIVSNAIFHSGANFTITAGDNIVFLPGTTINAGANVTAEILPCSYNLESCGTHSSIFKSVEDSQQEYNENDDYDVIYLENQRNNYKISIFPNPNPGTFKIETNFPLTEVANLKIINLLSVTIYETQRVVSNEIQLQNFDSGLHFVVMFLKDGTMFTQKVMVQR